MDKDTKILSRLYLGAAVIFMGAAIWGGAPAIAQTATSLYNLNSSITKPQAVVTTTCGAAATVVACPSDTKSQIHYTRAGASSVFLGFDATVTATTGLELPGGGKQAWDVSGGLVRCATGGGSVTLYTLCGRGN